MVTNVQKDIKIINENGILANCGGVTDSKEYSWGWRVWLDSCDTNGRIAQLSAGAALSTIAAALAALVSIPASVAFGIAAGFMAFGAATLAYYNRTGCGIVTDYDPAGEVITIKSQQC
ncbi:hypothetical protein SAMN05660649_00959 [Desulfotomaculum arcticum]|uniref:Uncharacterized protein n=1 Tax=Desulfotruncus arcticus DSM 17038 TaxID=1121424 RepID=A0A1I2PTM5_9FIRM|nr:hypothetical protein [Desulfotruncus arcticus]SFG16761.1 hypothetical protein SAMN05660649_00959 [Desulfotomaculum arcticum] [Desulfotruncus arcticus DSM 17038]